MLENVRHHRRHWILSKLTVGCQLRRIRATSNKSRDIPPVNMGHSVDEFFDVLAKDSDAGAKLPNWSVNSFFFNLTFSESHFLTAGAANSISRCVGSRSPLGLELMQRRPVPPWNIYLARWVFPRHGRGVS